MFKILKPFCNRASLGRISKIPVNGIHHADHHRMHRLSRYWSYFYVCGVSVCGSGSKKKWLFPAKKIKMFAGRMCSQGPFFLAVASLPPFFLPRHPGAIAAPVAQRCRHRPGGIPIPPPLAGGRGTGPACVRSGRSKNLRYLVHLACIQLRATLATAYCTSRRIGTRGSAK